GIQLPVAAFTRLPTGTSSAAVPLADRFGPRLLEEGPAILEIGDGHHPDNADEQLDPSRATGCLNHSWDLTAARIVARCRPVGQIAGDRVARCPVAKSRSFHAHEVRHSQLVLARSSRS